MPSEFLADLLDHKQRVASYLQAAANELFRFDGSPGVGNRRSVGMEPVKARRSNWTRKPFFPGLQSFCSAWSVCCWPWHSLL
jgi:hypothetical protein